MTAVLNCDGTHAHGDGESVPEIRAIVRVSEKRTSGVQDFCGDCFLHYWDNARRTDPILEFHVQPVSELLDQVHRWGSEWT